MQLTGELVIKTMGELVIKTTGDLMIKITIVNIYTSGIVKLIFTTSQDSDWELGS